MTEKSLYSPVVDDAQVFKALADESRRRLLDLLHERDGRTLSDLEGHLDMTRFGVMKHLRVLEEAGLVVTQRAGRNKLHYLNAVPIASVFDRWVGKYAQPHLRVLAGVKSTLKEKTMTKTETHTHVMETLIRAGIEDVWRALVDPDLTEKYYFQTRVSSSLEPGTPFQYVLPGGEVMLDGVVVACDAPRHLVTTFEPKWGEECVGLSPSRVTYELEESDGVTKLRLTHEGLPEGHPVTKGTFDGWSRILSGLKTLLETGQPL